MTGTWINLATVLVGGSVGLLLGTRLPAAVRAAAMNGVGLATVLLGIRMALGTQDVLAWMTAVIVGGALGASVGIADRLESGTRRVQHLFRGRPVAEGFLTASLLFCVGPMAIVGAIQDGLSGDWTILAAKSILDGISALALSAALGPGVLLSLAVILVYQGGITLAARLLGDGLVGLSAGSFALVELTAAGGAVVVALGFSLLRLRDLKPADFLPSLVLAPLLAWLLRSLG